MELPHGYRVHELSCCVYTRRSRITVQVTRLSGSRLRYIFDKEDVHHGLAPANGVESTNNARVRAFVSARGGYNIISQ